MISSVNPYLIGDIITDDYYNPQYIYLIEDKTETCFNVSVIYHSTNPHYHIARHYNGIELHILSNLNSIHTPILITSWDKITFCSSDVKDKIRKYYKNHNLDLNSIISIEEEEVP